MEFNGWLCPNGKLISCPIGKHGEIAQSLKPSKRGGYIHIFPSGAFADIAPTKKQRDWLKKSLELVDDETYIDMANMIFENWPDKEEAL